MLPNQSGPVLRTRMSRAVRTRDSIRESREPKEDMERARDENAEMAERRREIHRLLDGGQVDEAFRRTQDYDRRDRELRFERSMREATRIAREMGCRGC